MEKKALEFVFWLTLILVGQSVSFKSLYDRELKSTYGFEILKHYHDEQFGDEDVKHFNGESMLFMTPWRESGQELSLKYLKKFDYFVPCYYDFRKERINETEGVTMDISKYYS